MNSHQTHSKPLYRIIHGSSGCVGGSFFVSVFCLFLLFSGNETLATPLSGKIQDPLRAKAEGGDAASQFRLADEYFMGTKDRRQNLNLAAHWYLAAAENGLPEAMFNYALCLDRGLGMERDPYKAFEYYKKAAEKGKIPYAIFNYAQILRKGIEIQNPKEAKKKPENWSFVPDEKKAIQLLEQLAEINFAPAQTELAEIKLNSGGENPFLAQEAFLLLQKSAVSKETPAKTFRLLADCYYGGIGTDPDDEKMMSNLKLASDKGDLGGTLKLAFCYENGLRTKPDPKKALACYRITADAGVPLGQFKIAEAIEQGRYKDPKGNDEIEWYSRAAIQHQPQACYRLGEMAESGSPKLPKNKKLALTLYRRAAKKEFPRAQFKMGMMYLQKDEDNPAGYDPSAAVYWFRKGAEHGDTPSMRALAKCCLEGLGCDPNRSEGVLWLQRAANNGDILAEEMLKSLH